MVAFSDKAQVSAASKPLGNTRLVVGDNEFLIAVDEEIREKIVAEIINDARYNLSDPDVIEYLKRNKSPTVTGRRSFARDVFPQLAIIPAYLGLMAAILVEHFFPSFDVKAYVYKVVELVPVLVASAAALGNLAVIYLRKSPASTAQE